MQTKIPAMPLCPVCELTHTNHTLEYKTTSGKTGSMVCCVACRPKIEQRLRIARMDVLGIDSDEEDEEDWELAALLGEDEDENTEDDDFELPIKNMDEIIADRYARQHQEVLGREQYVNVGQVSGRPRKEKPVSLTGPLQQPALATLALAILQKMKV